MIHKSFLRILTCDALSYKQGNQYATIAENRVHDTALDDLDARDELAPCLLVYTDSGNANLSGQNPDVIATYFDVKLRIELLIYGHYSGFGKYVNDDRFLSIMLDVFEQQVFDALFKARNEKAQKFRDNIVFKSSLNTSTQKNTESDVKILTSMFDIDIQLPTQFNSSMYQQDRVSILDSYPNYISLIPLGIQNELKKVLAVNDAGDKLNIINTDLPIPTIINEFRND